MAGEKRFGTALFLGFKKLDVNSYIEKMLREFDDKLKDKDNEIDQLKNQTRDLKQKYEDALKHFNEVSDDRAKIGDVLIKAQEKAELMLQEAKLKADEEKKKLDEVIEQEKKKLTDIKGEVKLLKEVITNTLHKYQGDLEEIVDIEKTEGDLNNAENFHSGNTRDTRKRQQEK